MAASDISGSGVGLDQQNLSPEPESEEEATGGVMSLIEHLEELRKRLIISLAAIAVCAIAAFVFWERILGFLLTPLPSLSGQLAGLTSSGGHPRLIQTDIGEAFLIALQLSIAVGIVVASPVLLYQVWAFIAPALTRRERKYALPFTLLGVVLFLAGLSVGFIVLRYPVDWLINFGHSEFTLLLKADSYLSFVAYFLLAFGIVFELPLVLTFMGIVGIINSRLLREKRMYILFGLWFLSCFITPGADPYSPVIIGFCFTVLFELTIILMRVIGK